MSLCNYYRIQDLAFPIGVHQPILLLQIKLNIKHDRFIDTTSLPSNHHSFPTDSICTLDLNMGAPFHCEGVLEIAVTFLSGVALLQSSGCVWFCDPKKMSDIIICCPCEFKGTMVSGWNTVPTICVIWNMEDSRSTKMQYILSHD